MNRRGDAWYKDGLRFECTMCGQCCTGFPGTVTVDDAEIAALALRLDLTEDTFRERFTRLMPNGTTSLREKPDYDCVFYSHEHGCLVYEDRPTQCRNWPFWRTNVRNPACWDSAAEGCPGMNSGRLYSIEEIEERAGVTP